MFHKKQIFKLCTLKKLLAEENGCVTLVPCTRILALPPFFLNDLKAGILHQLNSLLKKYDRSVGGIIIGYQNIKILMDENTGIIPMGTSEIEVNIKVEFYVFQPKIGSFLKGTVNKKSDNHIGCLVHRYFNATILKPEEVDVEDWICKDYQIEDKILFKVKDLDFSSLLPSIEGIIDEENLLVKHKDAKSPTDTSASDSIICSVNNISFTRKFLGKIERNKDLDEEFLGKEKSKGKNNRDKDKSFQEVVNSMQENNFRSDRKKEKTKRKIEPAEENVIIKKAQDFSTSESTSHCVNIKTDGMQKKKKKKEKGKEDSSVFDIDNEKAERNEKAVEGSLSLGKYIQLENSDSDDFMTPVKLKKKKKKKKEKDDESFTKTFEGIQSKGEDNIFYSTQLEPNSESKMMISFCSPIPCASSGVTQHGKTAIGNPFLALTSKSNSLGKEQEKKKSKKRKREQSHESESVPKKMKTTTVSPAQKEDANIEKFETFEHNKRQLRNESLPKSKVDKDSESDISSVVGVSKMNGKHNRSDGLFRQNLDASVSAEKVYSEKETVKKSKKSNKYKLPEADSNIDTMHSKLNELNKEENKKSPSKSQKREKKSKTSGSEKGEMEQVINDLLYKKLARSGLSLENGKQSSFQQTQEVGKRKNKKDSELSDLSITSSKKSSSQKQSKHKEKMKDSIIPELCNNGSMYDVSYSPEKLNPDRSLFTDSEQSQSSPMKKRKAMNGIEGTPQKTFKVQNTLSDLPKNEQTREDQESFKHSRKNGKSKKESTRKVKNSGEGKETLFEKLLQQAKRLIDFKDDHNS